MKASLHRVVNSAQESSRDGSQPCERPTSLDRQSSLKPGEWQMSAKKKKALAFTTTALLLSAKEMVFAGSARHQRLTVSCLHLLIVCLFLLRLFLGSWHASQSQPGDDDEHSREGRR